MNDCSNKFEDISLECSNDIKSFEQVKFERQVKWCNKMTAKQHKLFYQWAEKKGLSKDCFGVMNATSDDIIEFRKTLK